MQRIGKVDKASLIEAGRKYVMPLFCEKARSAVVCNSEKAEEIRCGLDSMGLPLDVKVSVRRLSCTVNYIPIIFILSLLSVCIQITVEESILNKGLL